METPLLSLHLPEDGEDNNITIAASFNSASASDSEIQFQILQWGDSDSGSHHSEQWAQDCTNIVYNCAHCVVIQQLDSSKVVRINGKCSIALVLSGQCCSSLQWARSVCLCTASQWAVGRGV